MLIEFCVENHRAIREKQIFSMVPEDADDIDRLHWPFHLAETGHPAIPHILVDACLFGANGSGKSSFVDAMRFMTELLRDSLQMSPARKIPVEPFVLHPDWINRPSEFNVTFIWESTVYEYGFEVTQDRVLGERLSIRTARSKNWTVLFEREWSSKSNSYHVKFDKSLKNAAASLQPVTRFNALLLSTVVQFNIGGKMETAYIWLTEHFQICSTASSEAGVNDTVDRIKEERWKEKILDFFQDFGISLRNIGAEKRGVIDWALSGMSSRSGKRVAERKSPESEDLLVYFTRDDDNEVPAPIPLESESSGTQVLFSLAATLIEALENGSTIVMDELNPELHPRALENLIAMFCDPKTNTKNAQFIFTAHDPMIAQMTLIGRDQVWLMERSDDDWAARLFPLPRLKGRKGLENFVFDYLRGSYGGIPDTRREI